MFGKLHVMVAGLAATGLLAVGVPASATPGVGALPASVAAGAVSDLVNIRVVRADSPAAAMAQAAAPAAQVPTAQAAAEAANPYVVVIQNRSTDKIDIKVYWVQSNVNGALNTGGPVAGGAQYAFRLGGNDGCKLMIAYIVEVYYEGNLAASTPIIDPINDKDGMKCTDVWDVNVEDLS